MYIATPTAAASADGEDSKLIVECTSVDEGLPHGSELPTAQLDSLLQSEARASNVCLWLLFKAVRGAPVTVAAMVPTMGDMTFIDDATFLHSCGVMTYAPSPESVFAMSTRRKLFCQPGLQDWPAVMSRYVKSVFETWIHHFSSTCVYLAVARELQAAMCR